METTHTSGTLPFNSLPTGHTIPYRVYVVVAALRERGLRHSNRNNAAERRCTNPMALAIIMKISGEMLTSRQVKCAMNLWRTGDLKMVDAPTFDYDGNKLEKRTLSRPGPYAYGYLLQESIEPGYGHCAREITRQFHEIHYCSWDRLDGGTVVQRPTYYYKVKRGLVDLTFRGHLDAAAFIEGLFNAG